jgi:hypothetical protein
MADGRFFTDYRANCYTQNLIRSENGINNSFQYRMFLTNNAENLMDINRAYACQKNCCGPCQKPYDIGTMLPEQTTVKCNSNSCNVSVGDPRGLGQGRQYSDAPLHCPNWPESLPVNQPNNCCTPPADNFAYYPDSTDIEPMTRLTVPGGGIALTGGDNALYH